MATDIVSAILSIFGDISEWIISTLMSLTELFWQQSTASDGGFQLTFFGVMAVVSVGIGLIFLLIRVIQNFIKLRS